MSDEPAPLTPPGCDLIGLDYMPLFVRRLRKSKSWLMAKRQPELGFYMVNLWTAAWSEVPAASLEDDDDVLADAAMCSPDEWEHVREQVLQGWFGALTAGSTTRLSPSGRTRRGKPALTSASSLRGCGTTSG